MIKVLYASFFLFLGSCNQPELIDEEVQSPTEKLEVAEATAIPAEISYPAYDSSINTIHIFVALCDNFYQGIVPVPEGIGNGQDPRTNLYWGCGYGIKTYFKRSANWRLVETRKIDTLILERAIFKHTSENYYLIADAYNGKYIKQCTKDFLASSSGQLKDTVNLSNQNLGSAGNAKLIGYIGHNGLMDFDIPETYKNTDSVKRSIIALACASQQYFSEKLDQEYVEPILWTKALMCPEAYTIHDGIDAFIAGKPEQALDAGIAAYAKYQKCGKKGAATILVSGYE